MEMYNHDSDLQNSHSSIDSFDRLMCCWLWSLVQNVEHCKSSLILKSKSFRDGLTMTNIQNISSVILWFKGLSLLSLVKLISVYATILDGASNGSDSKKLRVEEAPPSRVLHIRKLPNEASETEVIALGLPFGKVTNILTLKGKNQVSGGWTRCIGLNHWTIVKLRFSPQIIWLGTQEVCWTALTVWVFPIWPKWKNTIVENIENQMCLSPNQWNFRSDFSSIILLERVRRSI